MYSSSLLKRDSRNSCTFYNIPEINVADKQFVTYKEVKQAASVKDEAENTQCTLDFSELRENDILGKAKSDAIKILADAQKEADIILSEANIKSQEAYSENCRLAQVRGYSEGMIQAKVDAQKQIDNMMEQLQSISNILVEEKTAMINNNENTIINLASEIAKKLVCENFMQEDTGAFLTVFQNTVRDIPPADRLIVTVSDKDYKIMTFDAEKLQRLASDFKNIEIRCENAAESGTLRLETPIMMIDASVNNQIDLIKREIGSLL